MKSSRSILTLQRCLLSLLLGHPDDGGLVYKSKVDRRPALRHHIFAVADNIQNHPETIAEDTQSLLMHVEKCIQ
jgi:hypothetical protein